MAELFNEDIKAACEVMQKGGVILYPTDTVYGLGCSLSNKTKLTTTMADCCTIRNQYFGISFQSKECYRVHEKYF